MSHKRTLDVVAPEQEAAAAQSPRKRLRRTVLVMMWLERRRVRGVTIEQMAQLIRQMQVEMARLCMLLMVLAVRLGTIERLLLEHPYALQRLLAEQLGAFQRSFMGAIEDRIRLVVQAEMQEQQAASLSNGVYQPPRQNISEGFPETRSSTRMVKLCFVDVERPKDPVYTGCPVQWQNGANTKVAIFENESQITQGDLSKLQIEILAVRDDFFTERGQANFTKEEFNKQIYTCKGKELVLTTVNLTNGEAYLGSFFFTESSHRKSLRLAARVKSQDLAVRVQEAITYPFVVKVHRCELNEKSYPPSKEEGVHRLEKISQKGKHFNNLAVKNITTVKHLLRYYHRDESGLRKITGMKEKNWNAMIKHAITSDPGDEIYSYIVAEENVVLLFNDFYDLVGMRVDGPDVPYSVNNLNQFHQLKVNNWKKSAHKKFEDLEKLGSLNPDYVMSNGLLVPVVCPKNDAGPSTQTTLPLQQYACGQTMHQRRYSIPDHLDPSMPQNGTYHLTQGNILNGQCSGSALPSHNIVPIQEDNLIISANLSAQHNRYSGFLTTDAPGTSPVIDGASQQTSLPNHVQTDVFRGLSSIEECSELYYGHVADLGFLPANNDFDASGRIEEEGTHQDQDQFLDLFQEDEESSPAFEEEFIEGA